MLEDIAALTGGQVVSRDLGMTLQAAGMEMLGRVRRVEITRETTTLVGGAGDTAWIEARVAQVRRELDDAPSGREAEALRERLAKLAGGVAIVHVGGMSEAEVRERRDRVEDALNATRTAVKDGVDYCPTPIGALSLRCRRDLRLGVDVWEIMLGQDFLMTSHFTASEVALGRLGVAAYKGDALDVVLGGLGLGYTAEAVLEETRVADLIVVEFLAPVIEWHETGILPMGTRLADDPHCRLTEGDFFAMAEGDGFERPGKCTVFLIVSAHGAPLRFRLWTHLCNTSLPNRSSTSHRSGVR